MGTQGCDDFVRYGSSKRESPKGARMAQNTVHPVLRDHKILLLLIQGAKELIGDPPNM